MNVGFQKVQIAVGTEMLNCIIKRFVGDSELVQISGKRRVLILQVGKAGYFRAVKREV